MYLTPWKSKKMTSPILSSSSFLGDDITAFQREMNSLMSNFLGNRDLSIPSTFSSTWYPSIDLQEKADRYFIDADVPGLNENDLNIDFHDNILTIKGESKADKKVSNKDYLYSERSLGTFRRDIYLDEEVNKDSITANLKNGVLHIEMTKKEKSDFDYKKIEIKH